MTVTAQAVTVPRGRARRAQRGRPLPGRRHCDTAPSVTDIRRPESHVTRGPGGPVLPGLAAKQTQRGGRYRRRGATRTPGAWQRPPRLPQCPAGCQCRLVRPPPAGRKHSEAPPGPISEPV
eukprot:713579-Hanusia_phi.AAC.1